MQTHALVIILLLYFLLQDTSSLPQEPLRLKSLIKEDAPRARCFNSLGKLRRKSLQASSKAPVQSLGQLTTAFYMQTKIGTPAKEVLLLVDTGSELTWVQCASCSHCSPTRVPPFDPGNSSSFISEPCSSRVCQSGGKLVGFQSECNRSSRSCSFQVAYLDGSQAYGVIAREIFTLQSPDGPHNRTSELGNMLFGCASRDLQNPVDFSSGTLGLNRGRYSFPTQIARNRRGIGEKFSYCFPNRAEHLNSSGVIIFGESGVPSESLQYITLEQYPPIANIVDFYYVAMVGISVEDELLRIPNEAFGIDRINGNGGTYFDSGTTVSFLVEPAHSALLEAFGKRVKNLDRTRGSDFTDELCYDVHVQDKLPSAPKVTLHFRDGVDMVLKETSLWVPLTRKGDVITICLAFLNAGPVSQGGVNVVGNYQQQDYLIEHDLKHSRIGFAPANCVID